MRVNANKAANDSASGSQQRETWIERLCKNDPDLKCPEHDKMSFMLACPDALAVLIKDAGIDKRFEDGLSSGDLEPLLEFPVKKGEGQYQTIIGFVDCACKILRRHTLVFIEAKPKLPNPMETLRQINTYKSFGCKLFLLWCPAITPAQKKVFEGQGVFVSALSVEQVENLTV